MKWFKRIIGLLALAGMLAVPPAASAADGQLGIYVAPKIIYGAAFMKDVALQDIPIPVKVSLGNKWDDTFGGSLAAGYDFSKKLRVPVRVELEYAIFSETEAGDSIMGMIEVKQLYDVQTLFLNAYYDIRTGTKFTPYIGAGLGAGFIRTEIRLADILTDLGSRTVTNFAWNVGLGLGYQITDNVALDISYRFADLGKVKTDRGPLLGVSLNTRRLYQHQFGIGARISF